MGIELTILYERGENDTWIAEIPEIPGATSHGASLEEARASLLSATQALSRARLEDAFQAGRLDGFERIRMAA